MADIFVAVLEEGRCNDCAFFYENDFFRTLNGEVMSCANGPTCGGGVFRLYPVGYKGIEGKRVLGIGTKEKA